MRTVDTLDQYQILWIKANVIMKYSGDMPIVTEFDKLDYIKILIEPNGQFYKLKVILIV